MTKWQQLNRRFYLKGLSNDAEQSDKGPRVKLNETRNSIFVGICDMCNLFSCDNSEQITIKMNEKTFYFFIASMTVIKIR